MTTPPSQPGPRTGATAAPTESLRSQTVRSGRYLYVREAIGIVIRAAGMILLTRLIGPTQYGLFAGPAVVNIFMVTVVLTGMDTVLIRRPGLGARWFHFVFTYLLLTSCVAAVLGIMFRGEVASLMGDHRMAGPFAVLAAAIPLNVLWVPGRALLERAMNYRKLAWIELLSDTMQYAVSLGLAFTTHFGVWAAVAGYLARQFILFVGVQLVSGYRPRLLWDKALLREGLKLGSGFSGGQLANRAGDLVVPIVVGRYLGTRDVGIAALTVRMAETLSFANRATYRLGVVALGRVQNNTKRLRGAVENFMAMQVLATGPMLTGFALCAWFVVPLFLGERWQQMIGLFPFIAVNYLINTQFTGQVAALAVKGKSVVILRNSAISAGLLFAAAFLLVPHFGLRGYAIAETIGISTNYLTHRAAKKILGGGVSYRKSIPWLIVLIPPLFSPATSAPLSFVFIAIPLVAFAIPWMRHELIAQIRIVSEGLGRRKGGGGGRGGPGAGPKPGDSQAVTPPMEAHVPS
jgi:O-antigen/teichoic acid export membrane protein